MKSVLDTPVRLLDYSRMTEVNDTDYTKSDLFKTEVASAARSWPHRFAAVFPPFRTSEVPWN